MNNKTTRVSVLAPDGKPLMPTTSARARRWLKSGRAKVVINKLNIFTIQLVEEPSGRILQDIALGVDPGKKFSGMAVASAKITLFLAHLVLPFERVKERVKARKILRRGRRGRRIKRNVPFRQRNHRQKRFGKQSKVRVNFKPGAKLPNRQALLPPSIFANKQMELQVIAELVKIFPINYAIVEEVKARGDKSFSPVMTGQKLFVESLNMIFNGNVKTVQGWQTQQNREYLGLVKDKTDKSKQTPETHANDALAQASTHFIQYKEFHTANTHGHHWCGAIVVTAALFRVIARPNYYRRQLHFEKPEKKPKKIAYRKRKGGTITPFGYRLGDYVKAEKAGKVYFGWVGGFTDSEKTKKISVYDINWNRIGQFSLSKVKRLRRKSGLLVSW